MNKSYLGDGVYVEFDTERQMIRLTTEDGVKATNTIYIEWEVWLSLFHWVNANTKWATLRATEDL